MLHVVGHVDQIKTSAAATIAIRAIDRKTNPQQSTNSSHFIRFSEALSRWEMMECWVDAVDA